MNPGLKRFNGVVFGAVLCLLVSVGSVTAANRKERRQLGVPLYTMETDHFRINYHKGVEYVAKRVGCMLEELYDVYTKHYSLVLPEKTEVLVTNSPEQMDNFASSNTNLISIAANDFGYNLRGSGNYLRDVVAHEFAHIVSINAGLKAPGWLLGVQVGKFSHPNNFNSDIGSGGRTDAFHVMPFEALPPWFFEGIAQYESLQMGGDRWDTHRDMILRTLALNDKLLSWDRMQVFTGRGDDYEKTYNHGFSLVRYIAEHHGRTALVGIMRESSKMFRINFDRSITRALGIPARQLYHEWRESLKQRYQLQLDSIGEQVYGRKLNEEGFDVSWPRFAPGDEKVYFLSNGDHDYSYKKLALYSYTFVDTVEDDKRVSKAPLPIQGFYDIHEPSRQAVYVSAKSPKSKMRYKSGGKRVYDAFIDSLPPEEEQGFFESLFQKGTERQVTEKKSVYAASFSPDGDRLAVAVGLNDRFFLGIVDTAEESTPYRHYPDPNDTSSAIQTIYSLDWSPDGHRIAFSYVQHWGDRKIGIYDTLEHTFRTICDTRHDERDPRFSPDGKRLYFASDRSGVFNIYRYDLDSHVLERLTNVTGGAFQPDISEDEKRLVYINYDKDGYGVYLLDSVAVLETQAVDTGDAVTFDKRCGDTRTVFTAPTKYNRFPRQFLLVPTVFGEETVTDEDNVYEGVSVLKAGAVMYLFDPFDWISGNELGAYFFVEPSKLFKFFDSKNIINPEVNYDFGVFGNTEYLPFGLSAEYMQRGIAGEDVFYSVTGELLHLDYNLSPRWLTLWASKSLSSFSNIPVKLSGVASYNWYNVHLFVEEYPRSAFVYSAAKGFRFGAYLTHTSKKTDRLFWMSPVGRAVKVAYDFYGQRLQDEEEQFDSEWHVNYNDYTYHQISASYKQGWKMPWSKKQRLYLDARGTVVEPTKVTEDTLIAQGRDPVIPSFYEPIGWLPGYTYYYRRVVPKAQTEGDSIVDTVLLSGNALTQLKLSYRFPLWPRDINRKLGFLFFERIYGAVNAYAGAAWHTPSDALKYDRGDWLTAIGAEIRLEAQSFYRYPLTISLRWDRGLDEPAPIGGDRFTLTVGFSFDDWGLIEYPDYLRTPGTTNAAGRRFVGGWNQ